MRQVRVGEEMIAKNFETPSDWVLKIWSPLPSSLSPYPWYAQNFSSPHFFFKVKHYLPLHLWYTYNDSIRFKKCFRTLGSKNRFTNLTNSLNVEKNQTVKIPENNSDVTWILSMTFEFLYNAHACSIEWNCHRKKCCRNRNFTCKSTISSVFCLRLSGLCKKLTSFWRHFWHYN